MSPVVAAFGSVSVLQRGAAATPPLLRYDPTATSASLLRVVAPLAYNRSPTVYDAMPVPPKPAATVVACHVPVVTVPSVVILVCPTYAAEMSITGVAPPVDVMRFAVPDTLVTVPVVGVVHERPDACVLSAVKTWPFAPTANRTLFTPSSAKMSPLVVSGDKLLNAAKAVVALVPPFAIGSVPETAAVSETLPYDGVAPTPPLNSTFPVATSA